MKNTILIVATISFVLGVNLCRFSYSDIKPQKINLADEICKIQGYDKAINVIVDGKKIKFLCKGDL
jgi:hypothetical protein